MVLRTRSGDLPAGTRRIDVLLLMSRVSGDSNDGYADSLSLVLTASTGQPGPPPTAGSVTVPGTADIYAAGLTRVPSLPGGGGTLPPSVNTTGSGSVTVSATGATNCCTNNPGFPDAPPDGLTNIPTNITSLGGISGTRGPRMMMLVGVFLGSGVPTTPAPPTLDFVTLGVDFPTLAPALQQVFVIGDGRTSRGDPQAFTVPVGATRLFLGFADGFNFSGSPGYYDDNAGSLTVTVMAGGGVAPTPTPGSGTSFDAAANFSTTRNPSGAWSYGWSTSLGATFTPGTPITVEGLAGWSGFRDARFGTPLIVFNGSSSTATLGGTASFPARSIGMHPGPNGEVAIVRWTAPAAGTYAIAATFIGRDSTSTDVHVLLNGTAMFDGQVNGSGSRAPFSSTPPGVMAGDTIDFAVGFGRNGTFFNDSTGLEATITLAGAPTPSGGATLQLTASSTSVRAGDRLVITLNTSPLPDATVVDLYAAVRLPGEMVLFFTGDPFNPFSATPAIFRRALSVTRTSFEALNIVIPDSVPPGTYTFLAAFIRLGQPPTIVDIVGQLAQLDVTIGR